MNNFSHKKSLGQNFLKDKNIAKKIASQISEETDLIIEIGPGEGALTSEIVSEYPGKKLILIEKDNRLIEMLQKKYGEVINADVLEVDFSELTKDAENVTIISNLPYNIATPLIMKLLSLKLPSIKEMIFMIQKEVAERFTAVPRTKAYGEVTMLSDYYAETKKMLFNVSPNAFVPKPKVESSVIKIIPSDDYFLTEEDEKRFIALVKKGFSQRRKKFHDDKRIEEMTYADVIDLL
jgi:16S rRNA (adenine1518-N6/adenine1519-N6)-dimethyltransferase